MLKLTVVIPAKNEQSLLPGALEAFAEQRNEDGSPIDAGAFELLVYCNDCDDATANVARLFARRRPHVATSVVETRMPPGQAHIGAVRREALGLAASRFLAAGQARGIVASTDADTVVSPTWVAATLREMAGVDAVAGFVSIDPRDHDRMIAPLRLSYDRELVYRRLIGFAEARFDPRPYDPLPRHDSFVGASFAVAAGIYREAGGVPALPRLEDRAFSAALERVDARVRHSYAVRASTSARSCGRVDGGFATFLAQLTDGHGKNEPQLVRSARAIREEAAGRRLCRRFWSRESEFHELAEMVDLLGRSERQITDAAVGSNAFGTFWQRLKGESVFSTYPDEPIQSAIASLRRALAECKPLEPTRSNVASGAG